MYVDDKPASGWAVRPDQLREFRDAVAEVRRDLNAVSREVADMGGPVYKPMLGTSPTGKEMAEKFTDRLSGDNGLQHQLKTALAHLEQFVHGAEKAAATYENTDQTGAERFRIQGEA